MRKRIWIPCIIALAACLLLLLLKPRQRQSETAALLVQRETPTNQPSHPEKSKIAEVGAITSPPRKVPPLPPSATPLAEAIAKTNPLGAQLLAAWQGAIEFYGKVVDQNGNAVAGAQVSFHWVEIPDETGNRAATTKSDAEGLFALHGQRGLSLGVSVSKEGYYASRRDNDTFVYGSIGGGKVSPDPQNPVVFKLREKGAGTSLIALKQNYRVPRDGTPLGIDLTTGKTTTGGGGDLVVQCWTEDQGKPSGAKYDWHCRVTPSGGLVTTDEEFPFTAPEEGYAPYFEIQMPADRLDWKSDVALNFYYRLADGRYGRMTFSMIAGGQHFCMIDSLLNPSGSRNLEPLEVKPPAPVPPPWVPPGARAVIPEFK